MSKKSLKERENFLNMVWAPHPIGSYVFIASKDDKSDYKFREFAFKKSDNFLDKVLERIEIEDNKERNIFYSVNSSSTSERQTKFINDTDFIQADLDDVDPQSLPLKPNLLVQTSEHCFQCIYELEKPISPKEAEKLSSILTKGVGADPAGLTATKLLRLPGTTNYKEGRGKFKVKLISHREKGYKKRIVKRALKKILPQFKEKKASNKEIETSKHIQTEIDLGCEKKVDQVFDLLKESISVKKINRIQKLCSARKGGRSEAIWQIINMLLDDKVQIENIVCVIFNSEAFKSKHGNRKERLGGEIQRALEKRLNEVDQKDIFTCIDDIEGCKPEFLYKPYIPKGMLTMLEGDPGDGKSTLCAYFAAQVSNGKNIFDGTEKLEPGKVLLFSTEDSPKHTLRPRLEEMNANLKNIYVVNELMLLDTDGLSLVENNIIRYRPQLVIVDPLLGLMDADSYKAGKVLPFMNKLAKLADEYRTTIITVRHVNKNHEAPLIYAGQGSTALLGGVRSALRIVIDDEEPDIRYLLHFKCNVAKKGKPLKFELCSKNNPDFARIKFKEIMDCRNDDLMSTELKTGKDNPLNKKEQARFYLMGVLSIGPRLSAMVVKNANETGISEKSIRSAREELCIKVTKKSNGTTMWELE